MANNWMIALKQWNSKKSKWCVPRKGTPEHAEIMKIKARLDGGKRKRDDDPAPARKRARTATKKRKRSSSPAPRKRVKKN